ncbi:MAG: transposase [Thermoplasmata archaeon]|uniref:Transposase n=1 Tax=Candidatus Sysuiplasma superficiale TaxID=2823368 RepID=A0A8J7YJR9_9ARCH|nr:transposase [Candidatus Sysuiplasma superficiale]MBX8644447.1 transposase [Candidatus Sysuiplasma superficiale]
MGGLPIIYVKAGGTSSKCPVCGDKLFAEEGRMMYCVKCRRRVDRDVNASINIFKRGMRFVPVGPAGEAMNGNSGTLQFQR